MYDAFSEDYDHFVNWDNRLAAEMPFILSQLQQLGDRSSLRVLDAACGTGMHVIALAREGFQAAGADLSPKMIARARQNAADAGVAARFEAAGFGKLAEVFGAEAWDALLCLGNSLPHALTPSDLAATLRDFAACLRPGGLLLVQNRNFDRVMALRERWMEPQAHRSGTAETLFIRFYDFASDGLIDFNILTLRRADDAGWTQTVASTRLHPLQQRELLDALTNAGFREARSYGSLAGDEFNASASSNLVITARK
jgi:SAM-dependent methyltransferase